MRRRRELNERAELWCPKAEHWVPIHEFSCAEGAIWYIVDRDDATYTYGKPQAYCRPCTREYNRERYHSVQGTTPPSREPQRVAVVEPDESPDFWGGVTDDDVAEMMRKN